MASSAFTRLSRTESQREQRRWLKVLPPEPPAAGRPRTRGECANVPRPCPYVSCRYHLYLDVTRAGGITVNFPELEPSELAVSCVLDVAEDGEHGPTRIGELMNMTKQAAEQLEKRALEAYRERNDR